MNRFLRYFCVLGLILLTAHRLPAPISEEETPRPREKSKMIAKPKTKGDATPKPRAPTILFAGNWRGVATGEMHAPLSPPSYSDTYNIQISADEKTVSWTASKWLGAKFQAPTRRSGQTLYWTYEKHDIAGKSLINSSLQLNSDGTATFHETDNIDNGMFKGSGYSVTGRFVRQ
jgi:hypothetical protein